MFGKNIFSGWMLNSLLCKISLSDKHGGRNSFDCYSQNSTNLLQYCYSKDKLLCQLPKNLAILVWWRPLKWWLRRPSRQLRQLRSKKSIELWHQNPCRKHLCLTRRMRVVRMHLLYCMVVDLVKDKFIAHCYLGVTIPCVLHSSIGQKFCESVSSHILAGDWSGFVLDLSPDKYTF